MNAPEPSAAPARRTSAFAWLLLIVLLPVAGFLAWRAWQAEADQRRAFEADEAARVNALEQRIATLRESQQGQGKRLQQAEATNRLLRDELLAMGQRAALIEDSVQRLAHPAQDAARVLRLDEIELLLAQAQQRLLLAGDLDGARSAYALAAQLLEALTDPADIDLRQVLAQERVALDALGADPRVAAIAGIDAFEAALDPTAARPGGTSNIATGEPAGTETGSQGDSGDGSGITGDAAQPWWQRLANRLATRIVDVRRSDDHLAVAAGDRAAALAALRLELSLARTAAERRDAGSHAAALDRAAAWLPRLWPESAARDARRAELKTLAEMPLALELPTLGTTLDQLRLQRARRAPTATAVPRLATSPRPDATPAATDPIDAD
ncbi:uroporphyrinogen-III C-methyltransferase [Luteimonas arsenica]|uniref:uroporphyrinogen-III C-methyltransferase n=1 Tax=Luteimonas arsenica TaxID=1586242 RepID=UPI0010566D09|nr:uroporphyrinogen-III C-methyltransferase [Luteimonas arsenica]